MVFTNFDLTLKKRQRPLKSAFLTDEELNIAFNKLRRFDGSPDRYFDFLETTRHSDLAVWTDEQILHQLEI
jgi:hypothetical protein